MTCGARMSDGRSADGRTARAPILRGGEGVKNEHDTSSDTEGLTWARSWVRFGSSTVLET